MRSCTVLLWSSDEAPQSTSHSGLPALPLSLCGYRVCAYVCVCVGVGGDWRDALRCVCVGGGGSIRPPCAACLEPPGDRHRCCPALLRLRPSDTVSAWRVCRVTPRDTVSGGVSAALFELRRPPPGWLSRLLDGWTAAGRLVGSCVYPRPATPSAAIARRLDCTHTDRHTQYIALLSGALCRAHSEAFGGGGGSQWCQSTPEPGGPLGQL